MKSISSKIKRIISILTVRLSMFAPLCDLQSEKIEIDRLFKIQKTIYSALKESKIDE